MTANELRKKYLNYFKTQGHTILPSAPLVPENDPTVLFTTAGMHPLVPYIMGERHPGGKRLANVQKCIRTGDIEEVGDTIHLTFFEMLGNWSLGDYGREDAIKFSFEFLTKHLGLNIKNLAVTCFEGTPGVEADLESKKIWMGLGIPEEKIKLLGKGDNFWGPPGIEGPCGPDTEMFVWTGAGEAPREYDPNDSRWMEIWNDVFMEFRKSLTAKGREMLVSDGEFIEDEHFEYAPLDQRNIDTGMGLERMVAYLQKKPDIYMTELFQPMIEKIEELSGLKYGDKSDQEYVDEGKQCWVDTRRDFRVIADHLKAAVFIMSDGVMPSNKDRGYILRRIIRRAIVKAKNGMIVKAAGKPIKDNFTVEIASKVYEIYGDLYFKSKEEFALILNELAREESKFNQALSQGLKIFEKQKHQLNGDMAFDLYQTYGFPLEMTIELAEENNIDLDINEFKQAFERHQNLSRTASAGMFKGGLADNKEATAKLHTAAHLMLAALRRVLGDHVLQKGSNITAERLRFDFSHPEKMTPEQIKKVEELVNEQIAKDVPVDMEEMPLEDAKTCGAMGVFESKYGENVKVYTVADFSKEICGGPHVKSTGELGKFKITKEESSSAGVRRIKAVLE